MADNSKYKKEIENRISHLQQEAIRAKQAYIDKLDINDLMSSDTMNTLDKLTENMGVNTKLDTIENLGGTLFTLVGKLNDIKDGELFSAQNKDALNKITDVYSDILNFTNSPIGHQIIELKKIIKNFKEPQYQDIVTRFNAFSEENRTISQINENLKSGNLTDKLNEVQKSINKELLSQKNYYDPRLLNLKTKIISTTKIAEVEQLTPIKDAAVTLFSQTSQLSLNLMSSTIASAVALSQAVDPQSSFVQNAQFYYQQSMSGGKSAVDFGKKLGNVNKEYKTKIDNIAAQSDKLTPQQAKAQKAGAGFGKAVGIATVTLGSMAILLKIAHTTLNKTIDVISNLFESAQDIRKNLSTIGSLEAFRMNWLEALYTDAALRATTILYSMGAITSKDVFEFMNMNMNTLGTMVQFNPTQVKPSEALERNLNLSSEDAEFIHQARRISSVFGSRTDEQRTVPELMSGISSLTQNNDDKNIRDEALRNIEMNIAITNTMLLKAVSLHVSIPEAELTNNVKRLVQANWNTPNYNYESNLMTIAALAEKSKGTGLSATEYIDSTLNLTEKLRFFGVGLQQADGWLQRHGQVVARGIVSVGDVISSVQETASTRDFEKYQEIAAMLESFDPDLHPEHAAAFEYYEQIRDEAIPSTWISATMSYFENPQMYENTELGNQIKQLMVASGVAPNDIYRSFMAISDEQLRAGMKATEFGAALDMNTPIAKLGMEINMGMYNSSNASSLSEAMALIEAKISLYGSITGGGTTNSMQTSIGAIEYDDEGNISLQQGQAIALNRQLEYMMAKSQESLFSAFIDNPEQMVEFNKTLEAFSTNILALADKIEPETITTSISKFIDIMGGINDFFSELLQIR